MSGHAEKDDIEEHPMLQQADDAVVGINCSSFRPLTGLIDEGVKVGDQLRGCFTRQAGQTIRSAARADLNAVPQQSLAGRNRHDIEADKFDITILAQPDAPG